MVEKRSKSQMGQFSNEGQTSVLQVLEFETLLQKNPWHDVYKSGIVENNTIVYNNMLHQQS